MQINPFKSFAFWSGLIAGTIMVGVMLGLAAVTSMVSMPEIISNLLLLVIPVGTLSIILTSLEFYAKPLLFTSILLGLIIAGGLLGIVYESLFNAHMETRRGGPLRKAGWRSGLQYGFALWLIVAAIFLLLLFLIPADVVPSMNPISFLTTLLISFAAYGLVLGLLIQEMEIYEQPAEKAGASGLIDLARRDFLSRLIFGLAAIAVGGAVWQIMEHFLTAQASKSMISKAGVLPPAVTPNNKFYIVSKNFTDPEVPLDLWKLSIRGLVANPTELTYEQLTSLPYVEEYVTLECISNTIGGDLMSNALWRGVRLRDLLDSAGVDPSVVDVSFLSWDNYSDSVPLDVAQQDAALVVYQMNGEPLPPRHGFPARLLVPGRYGMKSVKWLTVIEPVSYDFRGYWEQRGWSKAAVVKTESRIDVPMAGSILSSDSNLVGGVAFAGDRAILAVQISTDNGNTWQDAIAEPALSPYTWRIWSLNWIPPQPGVYTIIVRAVDGTGAVQTAQVTDALPDGASGLHSITVRVV